MSLDVDTAAAPRSHWPAHVVNDLLADLAGGATLTDACSVSGRPSRTTIWTWLGSDSAFCEAYSAAIRQPARAQQALSERDAALAQARTDFAAELDRQRTSSELAETRLQAAEKLITGSGGL